MSIQNRMLAAGFAIFVWGYPSAGILARPDANLVAIRWDREPSSFLGIKFNVPLKQQLPECGDDSKRMCWGAAGDPDDMGGAFTSIWNPPDLGFLCYISVFTVDSKVEAFTVKVPYDNYPKVHQVLVARYGQPTHEYKAGFETNSGQDYDNYISNWKGEAVVIELDQRDEYYNQTTFWVSYKPLNDLWVARKKASDAKSANQAASKL